MSSENREDALKAELVLLKDEHRRLEDEIAVLETGPAPDPLEVRRLKKHKLAVKDRIVQIEDELYPDIIA